MATVNKDFLDFNGLSIYDGKLNSERFSTRPTTFTGTHAEWDNLSTTEKAKYEYVNFTDDYNGSDIPASQITYSNTSSGLSATNTQTAIDELCTNISSKVSKSGDTMTGRLEINVPNGQSGIVMGGTNSYGQLDMFSYNSNGNFVTVLPTNEMSSHAEVRLPNVSGTIALRTDILPVVTRSLSSDSNISCVVTGEHKADMHINLTSQQPSGYSLYRVCMTMAWASGNAWDAAKSEVMGTNLRYYTEGLDVSDIDFVLYRERSLTVGEIYTPLNAYWIWAEWLPSYLFN